MGVVKVKEGKGPLDVVVVYAFDCTDYTPDWYRVNEVYWLVLSKLEEFPDSCLSYVYNRTSGSNKYTKVKTVVSGRKVLVEDTVLCDKDMASGLREAESLIRLSSKNPNGIILLFSDGSINNKGDFFDKTEDYIPEFPVHTFALGPDAYNQGLFNIAANSPGGTFNCVPLPMERDQSSPVSLMLDGILGGTMKDDEKPPTSNSEFHAACVDLWLTSWRTFCPVCRRDAMSGVSELPATEATPLLSSAVRLPSQPSSFRSSVAASPPRPISRHPSSHSVSRAYSVSSTPHSPNPFRSHTNLPAIHTSRSTADLGYMSSPHPRISHLPSTHSLVGSHLSPPISIRYSLPHSRHGSPSPHVSSPHISNSGYGSSSYYYLGGSMWRIRAKPVYHGPSVKFRLEANVLAGTSSAQSLRQSYLRGCGDSDANLSNMTLSCSSEGHRYRQSRKWAETRQSDPKAQQESPRTRSSGSDPASALQASSICLRSRRGERISII